jgi:hypothetical protein
MSWSAFHSRITFVSDDGPNLKRPYNYELVLDRIKRLLGARGRQRGG